MASAAGGLYTWCKVELGSEGLGEGFPPLWAAQGPGTTRTLEPPTGFQCWASTPGREITPRRRGGWQGRARVPLHPALGRFLPQDEPWGEAWGKHKPIVFRREKGRECLSLVPKWGWEASSEEGFKRDKLQTPKSNFSSHQSAQSESHQLF